MIIVISDKVNAMAPTGGTNVSSATSPSLHDYPVSFGYLRIAPSTRAKRILKQIRRHTFSQLCDGSSLGGFVAQWPDVFVRLGTGPVALVVGIYHDIKSAHPRWRWQDIPSVLAAYTARLCICT